MRNVLHKIRQDNGGFSLVETIVYIAGLVLLVVAIVSFMYYMYRWYDYATVVPRVDQVGTTLVDRIVRDVRSGTSINLGSSSFGTTLGAIDLTSSPNGTSVTKHFAVSGGRATYAENGGAAAYFTPAGMTVTQLQFSQVTTSVSYAIRVDCIIQYATRTGTSTREYTGLAVLRNSYQ